jgi:alpha-galactosidase
MRDALLATGRPIFYSICSWGEERVGEWGNMTGNSWRTTIDITPYWEDVRLNFKLNNHWAESAGPGGWNDPDMLEVGVTKNGKSLTTVESATHFALWAIVKAPLILGVDLNNIS